MSSSVTTGTVVAGFRIVSLIGEGAMGSVYLAENEGSRRVALKLLSPELTRDERFRRRFLRESQVAASLDHPHVVPTIASGEDDGVLYLAMEYVEGSDLRELLKREGRLRPERAVALIAQVAAGLDAAHAAGLVHRDVKPGNILVVSRPEREHAYVCDFGLARHVTSVSSLTGERGFVGTIDYVSPEQIEGGPVDGRADQYSLTCVLYQCLTGERPFDRDSELAVVFAHLNEPPPRVTDLQPDLPQEFDAVFATALAKAPGDRYDACGELAAAAQAALQGKVRRRRRRRPVLVAAAALAVAAGGVAGGILATRGGSEKHARASPSPITLRPNALNLISARAGRVVGSVPLGRKASTPFAVFDVVGAGRSAWVLDGPSRRLLRVDLVTHRHDRVLRLPWAPAGRIAIGGGRVWIPQDGGRPGLLGVDARTGRIARRFEVAGGNAVGVAFGGGSVWLAQGDAVVRLDPADGRVQHRIVLRPGQHGNTNWLVFADGFLWSADENNGVVRELDPVTNRVVAKTTVHGSIGDLTVGGSDVWVSIVQDGVLQPLNEDDLTVETARPAGLDPERISLGGGNVWVANTVGGSLSSVSRLPGGARHALPLTARPQTATYSSGLLLTVATPKPRPLPPVAGEDVRLSTEQPELNADPDAPTNALDAEIGYVTCANLLGYPDESGSAGGTLRPEVAAAMPEVSNGGRTYTFRIRPGFRFSPPSNEPVTAQTFRHTLERVLSPRWKPWGGAYVSDVVGEDAFRAGKATHISGIVARENVLQITLVRPAGDFLTRISTPYFCPVPSTVGIQPASLASQVPRDGPYYVSSVTSDRTVLLRNPNYGGSRPRRPARIVFENGTPVPQAVALANRGLLDYLPPDFSGNPLLDPAGPLAKKYGPGSAAARAGHQRYMYDNFPGWDGVVLNASRPLFRSLRMRRAVAYALDRRTLAGNHADLPADAIVPPAVPGFPANRVFPLRADLGRARRLAGPGRRTAILDYCTNGPFGGTGHVRVAELIRAQLARIGIAVSISSPPCAANGRYDANSRGADLVLVSSFSPVLDPAPFISSVLSKVYLGGALGPGLWTTPRFLARVQRAYALRGSARRRAYLRLEDDLLRAAPVVVFGSFYEGHYFSPRIGCRVLPPGVGAFDLATLCKR